jgi:hypothetical protein
VLPGSVCRGFDDFTHGAHALAAVARSEPTYVIVVHVSASIKHHCYSNYYATQVINAI